MAGIRQRTADRIKKTRLGGYIISDVRNRAIAIAACGLAFDLLYALYNAVLGIVTLSVWIITCASYYLILGVMRFAAVAAAGKASCGEKREIFVMRFSGIMLMIQSIVITGTVIYSHVYATAKSSGEIFMITVAAYTFYKVILASVNAAKARKKGSVLIFSLRNISAADAAVSLLTLQRSMLVSFGEMPEGSIKIFNAAFGAVVSLTVFLLGAAMLLRKKRTLPAEEVSASLD